MTLELELGVSATHDSEVLAADAKSLLQAVLDGAGDLIFVKDLAGRVVLTNQAVNEATDIAIGERMEDRLPIDPARECAAEDRHVIATGQRSSVPKAIPVGPSERTFQTSKVPWRRGGKIAGVVAVSRDITDQLAAERALRESEERHRLVAKATQDVIWDWNLETGSISWNEAALRLAGEVPESQPDWWTDRIHPEDRKRVISSIDNFLAGIGEHWRCDYRFRQADGSYAHISNRAYPLRRAGRTVRIVGAIVDLSERINAQIKIRELQATASRGPQVEAMGPTGSTLAHQLSEPLVAAANYIAAAQYVLQKAAGAQVGIALDVTTKGAAQIERAGEIIRRLSRMAKDGRTELKSVDLRRLIDDAVVLAAPARRLAGLRISISVPEGMWVAADTVQTPQVLCNLLWVAAVTMAPSNSRELAVSAVNSGEHVVVRMADHGRGITAKRQQRLFEPFTSTEQEKLRDELSIYRTNIEADGGTIWVENRASGDAVFCFSLRLSASNLSL